MVICDAKALSASARAVCSCLIKAALPLTVAEILMIWFASDSSAVDLAICSVMMAAVFLSILAETASMLFAKASSAAALAYCSDQTPANTAAEPAFQLISPASGGFTCANIPSMRDVSAVSLPSIVSIDVSTLSTRTVNAETASPKEEYSPIFVQ